MMALLPGGTLQWTGTWSEMDDNGWARALNSFDHNASSHGNGLIWTGGVFNIVPGQLCNLAPKQTHCSLAERLPATLKA